MAIKITDECINCGACEPECPNNAIYEGGAEWRFSDGTGVKGTFKGHNSGIEVDAEEPQTPKNMDLYYIVSDKCTECVGFFDHEACAAVCPVACCIPDPARPESEAVLFARAEELHEAAPPSAPCTANSGTRRTAIETALRGVRLGRPRRARKSSTMPASASARASAPETTPSSLCTYSIRVWYSHRGTHRPKHVGQSGQPSPEPVARTTPPQAINVSVEAVVATASFWNRVMSSRQVGRAARACGGDHDSGGPGQPAARILAS